MNFNPRRRAAITMAVVVLGMLPSSVFARSGAPLAQPSPNQVNTTCTSIGAGVGQGGGECGFAVGHGRHAFKVTWNPGATAHFALTMFDDYPMPNGETSEAVVDLACDLLAGLPTCEVSAANDGGRIQTSQLSVTVTLEATDDYQWMRFANRELRAFSDDWGVKAAVLILEHTAQDPN